MVGSTSEHVSPLKDPGITAAQRPREDRKRKQNIDKNVGISHKRRTFLFLVYTIFASQQYNHNNTLAFGTWSDMKFEFVALQRKKVWAPLD